MLNCAWAVRLAIEARAIKTSFLRPRAPNTLPSKLMTSIWINSLVTTS